MQLTGRIVSDRASPIVRRAISRCRDFRPAWRRVKTYAHRETKRQFVEGGIPDWEPLSALTESLRRSGPGVGSNRPLWDTGRLMKSWTGDAGEGFSELGRFSMEIGSNVSYADKHQHGTRRMPARPVVVTERLLKYAEEAVVKHATGR